MSGVRKRKRAAVLLGRLIRPIKGILDAIEDGMYQPSMKARMSELEQQKAEIEHDPPRLRPMCRTCIRISLSTIAPR
jgi:hypothetical protein